MHTFPTPKLPKLEVYPFTDFVEYVVSTHPRFSSLAGIIRAGRIVNGTRHEDGLVRWADDDAKIMQEICAEEDEAKSLNPPPLPLTQTIKAEDGTTSTVSFMAPGLIFLPFVLAILESKPDET